MNKELFYLAMAALGGYAAYLAIKEHYQKKQQFSGLLDGGFGVAGQYDFLSQQQNYNWLEGADPNKFYGV
jgi:hypothetical protein